MIVGKRRNFWLASRKVFIGGDLDVGAREIDLAGHKPLNAGIRADSVVTDLDPWGTLVISLKPFGINRIGEGCSGCGKRGGA